MSGDSGAPGTAMTEPVFPPQGLPRFEARKAVLSAQGAGAVHGIEDNPMVVPLCRSEGRGQGRGGRLGVLPLSLSARWHYSAPGRGGASAAAAVVRALWG